MAKAVCYISGNGITGNIYLSQASEDAPTLFSGKINGLLSGDHGMSINVFGDLTNNFNKCGGHFNPFGKQHGDRNDDERHVGSLGNITATNDSCTFNFEDKYVKLIGPQSVIGRSIIIYTQPDDLGKGGNENSLINGNVGPAIAGGVIGIASSM
ncbi:hypothetical protein WA158_004363 [Blastocystis sp. Blastoise]